MQSDGSDGTSKHLPINVLLIEHDPAFTSRFETMLSENNGHRTFHLECEKQLRSGLERLAMDRTDVVVLDLSLPDGDGLNTIVRILEKAPSVPIVVLNEGHDGDLALEAFLKGAQDYLARDEVEGKVLAHVIRYAIERKHAEAALRESKQKLKHHNRVLVQLAKSRNLNAGNIDAALKEITKVAAQTLEVERVSVWFYDDSHKMLQCEKAYERSSNSYSKDERLEVAKYANYFDALERGRFIAVSDIHSDWRTREFLESNLPEFGVSSMLDAPIRLGGRTIGAVCHWHTGKSRQWTSEEQSFAGSMADLVSLVMEACERKRAEENLTHLAYYDALTGLPNRPLLLDRLNHAIASARRKQSLVTVLFLDLDYFNRINDTVGHAGGDELLNAVAKRLKQILHKADTVSRIGADSFVILLTNIWRTEDAIKVAERIAEVFKSPFQIGLHEFFMTCSIGVSFYPADGQDAATLLKNANASMYRAKQKGRNNYQFYSPAMNAKVLERLALENSLRHALERGEFRVYYQPFIDIARRTITGAEALIRWEHPSLGLILPQKFIPLAEETGLIVPVGEWVMKTACAQNKVWQCAGYEPICVSVNLSVRQFQHSDFSEVIRKVLKETGLDPKHLQFELTESLVMQNAEESVVTLRKLKAMNVRLSIDDFGTGYSSLNYLKRFPIDTLKIDRSFIRDVTTDHENAAIVKAIISMAHSLKMEVIAEGVETEAQLEFLSANGCDKMQGFIYSRAVPANTFEQLLDINRHAKKRA